MRDATSSISEDPSAAAELRIEFEPEGRSVLMAKLPDQNAKDLLPLVGVIACVVGPALTFWTVSVAGMPFWVPMLVVAIQVCGIVALVKYRRA